MREGGVSVERVALTGREVALLSGMNYRRFFDSWCRLCGKYRLCQVNFEKASIFGQRQSAWPFWEQPQFSLFHLFFLFFFFLSMSVFLFFPFLSSVCLSFFLSLLRSLLSWLSVWWGWHARPWQQRRLIETATVYQHIPLMKRPSRFCWNICTNLLEAASIRRRPLLENKYASSVDRQLYSPACVLH